MNHFELETVTPQQQTQPNPYLIPAWSAEEAAWRHRGVSIINGDRIIAGQDISGGSFHTDFSLSSAAVTAVPPTLTTEQALTPLYNQAYTPALTASWSSPMTIAAQLPAVWTNMGIYLSNPPPALQHHTMPYYSPLAPTASQNVPIIPTEQTLRTEYNQFYTPTSPALWSPPMTLGVRTNMGTYSRNPLRTLQHRTISYSGPLAPTANQNVTASNARDHSTIQRALRIIEPILSFTNLETRWQSALITFITPQKTSGLGKIKIGKYKIKVGLQINNSLENPPQEPLKGMYANGLLKFNTRRLHRYLNSLEEDALYDFDRQHSEIKAIPIWICVTEISTVQKLETPETPEIQRISDHIKNLLGKRIDAGILSFFKHQENDFSKGGIAYHKDESTNIYTRFVFSLPKKHTETPISILNNKFNSIQATITSSMTPDEITKYVSRIGITPFNDTISYYPVKLSLFSKDATPIAKS